MMKQKATNLMDRVFTPLQVLQDPIHQDKPNPQPACANKQAFASGSNFLTT
jgi:hypothetical protein